MLQKDEGKTKQEVYRVFVEFIQSDMQRERKRVNRRMFNVFVWCFLTPAIFSTLLLILAKKNWIPHSWRSHLDWIILIFPVSYSLYVLGSEVLREIPSAIRQGGISSTLGQALREGEWRERVSEGMRRLLGTELNQWKWIVQSFKMDLKTLRYRTRFLTALAGAVFFLIMQGIDSISDNEPKLSWVKNPIIGWVDASGGDVSQYPAQFLAQFVGLALFLLLFYLSGSQTYHSLARYLGSAELLLAEIENQPTH